MYFGGDYNPEQWDERTWLEDAKLMREARVNLVSVGIFSWARLQPAEGEFDFEWLDRVLEIMHDNGIAVDLATATASPPPWVVHRYPEILPVTSTGVRLAGGSRQHFSPTSPDYRRLASELVSAIGGRYANHPAVVMWHVNNEFACHVRADYSPNATRAFRTWLLDKYGNVAALNAAWGADFWAQRYSAFEEIDLPRLGPTTQHPSATLDFRRFTSDSMLELYTMERDLLRDAGATQPVTTNLLGLFPVLDYWRWAQEMDIVANDNYPDPRDADAYQHFARDADLMRSLRPGQEWLLMEQAPNQIQWRANNAPKAPGQLAAWSEQALSRGASSVLFFQWRQSRYGAEKFHSAMYPQSGKASRTWDDIVELGASLEGRPTLQPTAAKVAIVLDWPTWWALDQVDLPVDIDYRAEIHRWYAALHDLNVQTSFVPVNADLSAFQLVIAPTLYLLDPDGADALRRYVDGGGHLLTTAFTDLVDEHDHFRDGGYGVQLAPVLGGQPVDFFGVLPEDGRTLTLPDQSSHPVTKMHEDFVVSSGAVLSQFDDGSPLLVRNQFGAGVSLHLATLPDDALTARVVQWALAEANVAPVLAGLPAGVEAIPTSAGITVINHGRSTVRVEPDGMEPFTLAPQQIHWAQRA